MGPFLEDWDPNSEHIYILEQNSSHVISNLQYVYSFMVASAVARPNGQPRQAGVARGVRGHAPPLREILNFSLSEMRFAAFSGPFGNFFSS